ncbi:hypothetical protein PUN28_013483 [Cardiocondyla obscurior]|uniref:Uncharacterized protein n=1 Tax=Cardiocondyla obscurior TaxID=286306 RepID=A0AAW2F4P2_9HYME
MLLDLEILSLRKIQKLDSSSLIVFQALIETISICDISSPEINLLFLRSTK